MTFRLPTPRRARRSSLAPKRTAALLALGVLAALLATAAPAAAAVDSPMSTYQTNGRVWAITMHKGVIYIGGDFTKVRPAGAPAGTSEVTRNHAAAIDESTGKLLPWNPNVNGRVYHFLVQKVGVFIGGNFSRVGAASRDNIALVDATSGAVKSWHLQTDGYVRVIRKGPNGNYFLGGRFRHINGKQRWEIAEVTPAGNLVNWAPQVGQISGFACPPRCVPKVWTIVFHNNIVYFGGHFGLVNGVTRNEAAAVGINDDQHLTSWNPNIYANANCPTCQTVETERVFNMIVYNSKMYMCGGFWLAEGGNVKAFNLLVTNLTNGAKDPTFAAGNDGDTPACVIRNGVFYFGGHFNWVGPTCSQNPPGGHNAKCTDANSTRRNHIAAVDATTGALLPWNPGANSAHGVWGMRGDSGHLGVGGDFTKIGGVNQEGFAEFDSSHLP